MADFQTQFNKFHEAIKIAFEENKPLRDKRDLIVKELRNGLKWRRENYTFSSFNQGSYDMATGVKPLQGDDYDIDIGLIFNLERSEIEPVKLKKIVYDILNAVPQRTVEMKRPCVRVQYIKNKKNYYHVDLAIYAREKYGFVYNNLYIAKGFIGSSSENKIWETSAPNKLKEAIKSKFLDNRDREQFRRVIRYLKRWKDYNFQSSGHARPTGIALTALCYNLFRVKKRYNNYNDLEALKEVVSSIIYLFSYQGKIAVYLPVEPRNNLFEKMSLKQMQNLKSKLEDLKIVLVRAYNCAEYEKSNVCLDLQRAFGDDFPNC